MSNATRVTIAAIVLLTAALGLWMFVEGREADAPQLTATDGGTTTHAAATSEIAPILAEQDSAGIVDERAEVPVETPSAPSDAAAAPDTLAHLDGRFVDITGRGIAGVRIVQPVSADGRVVESDDQGNFAVTHELKSARSRMQRLEARADGWATHYSRFDAQGGETKHRGQVLLVPGGAIRGVVVDENGNGIADARVLTTKLTLDGDPANLRRTGPPAPWGVPEAKSVQDGSFELGGVPAELLRAWAASDGRLWAMSEPVEVPAQGVIAGVVLELVPLALDDRIEGILLDPSGQPVKRAYVNYRYKSGDSSGASGVRSGDDGRFRIVLKHKVPHDLSCDQSGKGWGGASLAGVQPGTLDVVLRLVEARKLELIVHDEKGDPIDAFGFEVATDGAYGNREERDGPRANGRVEIAMPSTSFTIAIWARGRARIALGPFEPAGIRSPFVCTLEPMPGLRGRVLKGKTPVVGAKLMLHRFVKPGDRYEHNGYPSRLESEEIETESTDKEGRFQVTLREAGTFALLCESAGNALAELSPLEIDPRIGRDGIELQVNAGGVLEGRVLTPAGRDAAGVIVGITRYDCRSQAQRIGTDGRFRFEKLTPGGWSVRRVWQKIDPGSTTTSHSSGGEVEPHSFDTDCVVEAGRATTFDLDLRDSFEAALVGRVTVNGAPATGWTVTVLPGEGAPLGQPPSGVVDGRGDVRVALPCPASYSISLRPSSLDGTPVSMGCEIEVHAGDNHWVADLECGTLEGIVTGYREGMRLACGAVRDDQWNCGGIVQCDEQGRYRVPHVLTGSTRVWLHDTRAQGRWDQLADKRAEIVRGRITTLNLP